mgnify:CR=1 FL=1
MRLKNPVLLLPAILILFFSIAVVYLSQLKGGRKQKPLAPEIKLASEFAGYQLQWEDREFFLEKLDEFGFWQAVFLPGLNRPVSVKGLTIVFTDQEQKYDKISTSGFSGPIRTWGAAYDGSRQTAVLKIHLHPDLVRDRSFRETGFLVSAGALRAVYALTLDRPMEAKDFASVSALEIGLREREKLPIRTEKKFSLNFGFLRLKFKPVQPVSAACMGHYWVGVWHTYYQCGDGTSCDNPKYQCDVGDCTAQPPVCDDASPKNCGVFPESNCAGNCPTYGAECCASAGCYVPAGAPPPGQPS